MNVVHRYCERYSQRGKMENSSSDLVGVQEIARWAGVRPSAVANWRTRGRGFPEPVAELAAGPVFKRDAIRKWLRRKRPGMTTTIAFINLKGGVAKTTTAVATAQILAGEKRKRVLFIDLDPQTNATVMLIGDTRWKTLNDAGHTIAQLFRDALDPNNRRFDLESALQEHVGAVADVRRLSLLPGSLDLIRIQDDIVTMPTGRYRSHTPVDILHRAIRDHLSEYDFVLIDCPPSLGLITLNGLRFADGYVIPTVPDVLSTYGIPQIVERVGDFAQEIGEPIEAYGILATKYQGNSTVHETQMRLLRRQQDAPVFDTIIRQTNELSAAAEFKQVSTLRQKWGYREGFPAYSRFVDELVARVAVEAHV